MARTRVARPVAFAMVLGFLLLLGIPGVVHLVASPDALLSAGAAVPRALVSEPSHPFVSSRNTLRAIDAFEGELRNGSPVADGVRPWVQQALYGLAGVGNQQVVVAGDEPALERTGPVLYFRPSLQHVMGEPFLDPERLRARRRGGPAWETPPEPDPRQAVRHFAEDLARRGVELIVIPVPVKASIDAGPLGLDEPLDNPSRGPFDAHLERLGVRGPDVTAILRELDPPRFLETDTHWRPEAVDAVAAAVAKELGTRGVERRRRLRRGRPVTHTAHGDLADLLGMAAGALEPDTVQVAPLLRPPERADASVLVLGDSFAGIYEDPSLGFGADGGFADALAHHLGRAVDSLVLNAGGASQVRQALADDVERLESIDVVVWLFTARELSVGDWRRVRLPDVDAVLDPRWVQVDAPQPLTGRIDALGAVADPSESPYPDQLLAISVAVEGRAPGSPGSVAWGYTWGLRERVVEPAGRARVGQARTWSVRPFADAPPEALRAGRSEVDGRPPGVPLLWFEWGEP